MAKSYFEICKWWCYLARITPPDHQLLGDTKIFDRLDKVRTLLSLHLLLKPLFFLNTSDTTLLFSVYDVMKSHMVLKWGKGYKKEKLINTGWRNSNSSFYVVFFYPLISFCYFLLQSPFPTLIWIVLHTWNFNFSSSYEEKSFLFSELNHFWFPFFELLISFSVNPLNWKLPALLTGDGFYLAGTWMYKKLSNFLKWVLEFV